EPQGIGQESGAPLHRRSRVRRQVEAGGHHRLQLQARIEQHAVLFAAGQRAQAKELRPRAGQGHPLAAAGAHQVAGGKGKAHVAGSRKAASSSSGSSASGSLSAGSRKTSQPRAAASASTSAESGSLVAATQWLRQAKGSVMPPRVTPLASGAG